jgi:hypothetical protein
MNQPQTPDTTPTPRTDEARHEAFGVHKSDYDAYVYMANHAEELERELAEKTNEVAILREELRGEIAWRRAKESELEKLHDDLTQADSLIRQSDLVFRNEEERRKKADAVISRLRELCSRLIAKLDHSPYCRLSPKSRPCDCHVSKASSELEELAPAPEEPANPTCSNTTHKFSHCDCKKPATEWRVLGRDEVICEGDEYYSYGHKRWVKLEDGHPHIGAKPSERHYVDFRTRRPLPVQEEMPLEKELNEIYGYRGICPWNDAYSCLRYLRDEIQKLKQTN